MLDYIYQFWVNSIWLPFIFLVVYFESKPAGIYILIVILIVLALIQPTIIKNKLPKAPILSDSSETKHKKQTKKMPFYARKELLFRALDGIFTLSCLFVLSLIIGVCLVRFSPVISDFFKDDTNPSNNSTTSPSTNTQTQNTTPAQTQTPIYQAPKQMYYFCSCSNCYAAGCPGNGYSYSGYSESTYIYYKSLCQACSCSSLYARSYWR